ISSRGAFYVRTWRGKLIAQAWPRPRGRPRDPAAKARLKAFAEAVKAWRYLDPETKNAMVNAFKRSQVLARDAFTAQLYGTQWLIRTREGTKIYPARFQRMVSAALDAIGAQPGTILSRTATGWKPIAPAPEGRVLTSQGPGAAPTWAET
ncbi:MAG: hypothetical protein K6U77_12965, partial [Armatimonadetes bacterium]|nr:hypothetical protein [Armatimonadota bacterium]